MKKPRVTAARSEYLDQIIADMKQRKRLGVCWVTDGYHIEDESSYHLRMEQIGGLMDKVKALRRLLVEYGVLPLAQRSDLAPPVALNYKQACKIAEVLNA